MKWLAVLAGLAPFAVAVAVSIVLWLWLLRTLVPADVYGPPGRALILLGRLRTLGLLISATAYLVCRGIPPAVEPLEDGVRSLPAVLLGMLVVLLAARSGRRAEAALALRRPAVTALVLALVGVAIVLLPTVVTIPDLDSSPPDEKEVGVATVLWALQAGSWLATALALGAAVVLVCYLAVRHWCRSADGHPMLPAIVTICYAVLSAGWYFYGGPTPDVPVPADLVLALSGPATLVCLAAVELVVLHGRGITLAGPPPRQAPEPWVDVPLPTPRMPPGVIFRPY
jgi:hypothetical protein